MSIQASADEIIAAYMVCGDALNPLEREHGYILNVRRSGDNYIWMFVDRATVTVDKTGKLVIG